MFLTRQLIQNLVPIRWKANAMISLILQWVLNRVPPSPSKAMETHKTQKSITMRKISNPRLLKVTQMETKQPMEDRIMRLRHLQRSMSRKKMQSMDAFKSRKSLSPQISEFSSIQLHMGNSRVLGSTLHTRNRPLSKIMAHPISII